MAKRSLFKYFWVLHLLILLYSSTTLLATDSYYASYIKGTNKENLDNYILDALSKRLELILGVQFNYRGATIGRNLLLLKQGHSDLAVLIKKHVERLDYLYYIEPALCNLNVSFVVRKGEHDLIQNYEDLYGLRIGTYGHAKSFSRFDEDKQLKKIHRISVRQDINKLLLNRLDAVLIAEHTAGYMISLLNLQGKVELSDYAYRKRNPLYIVLSKNAPIMKRIDEIEPIIKKMLESGEMRMIMEQFYIKNNLPIPKLW